MRESVHVFGERVCYDLEYIIHFMETRLRGIILQRADPKQLGDGR